MSDDRVEKPRRRAAVDIKLLRVDLLPRGRSPCEDIGHEWSPAQPTETLSPSKAAAALGVEVWAPPSVVKKRFLTLQMRYPPEQFPEKHVMWRPSAELLGNSRARLNWYWQSGLVPVFWSEILQGENLLWDSASVEPPIDPKEALERFCTELSASRDET